MDYELRPFADCGTVTLDELADNASGLLNLAIEEQRPLRVSIENGREFLMFPPDFLAPFYDHDFNMILLAAMRYAMGKNTFMPLVIIDYIKRHIQLLDRKFLVLAADDIRHHFEDYGELEPNPELWQELLTTLEAHQKGEPVPREEPCRPCPACGAPLEVLIVSDAPGGFDMIAHCWNCDSDYEWFQDSDGNNTEMKRYFFG